MFCATRVGMRNQPCKVKTFSTFEEAYQHGKKIAKKQALFNGTVEIYKVEIVKRGNSETKVFAENCGRIVKDALDRFWIELHPDGCKYA